MTIMNNNDCFLNIKPILHSWDKTPVMSFKNTLGFELLKF